MTPKVFGLRCRHCQNPLNVFHVGAGVHYELPCSTPGCMASPPGEGYKTLTPLGFGEFERERARGSWRWVAIAISQVIPKGRRERPVESDGWITVHP